MTQQEWAEPEAVTTSGRVRGAWRHHVSADATVSRHAVFRGIPFAAAPVGPLRFAAPVPPSAWEGTREAVAYGPTAQRMTPYAFPRIPEPSIPGDDILTVNVTTPDPSASAGLPVLVWIHGGGFEAGSPASPWYEGGAFARDGVVVVTLAYRLAFEGFGWIDGGVNNRAVRDWLAGLEWVQRNIAAFGGDPAKVTIAGQSAGGAAVLRLLTMPAAQPFFAGVIAVSPPDASVTVEQAREASAKVARAVGAPDTSEQSFAAVDHDSLWDARGAATVDPESPDSMLTGGALMLAPVIDGELIPQTAAEALATGVGEDKPVFLGATAHEFRYLADQIRPAVGDGPAKGLLERNGLPPALAADLVAREGGRGAAWVLGMAISDALFRAPVAGVAGARASAPAPTWVYDFRWESRSPSIDGAAHCVDVPFGFDILGAAGVDHLTGRAPQALADAVHGDWLSIVTNGRIDAPPHSEGDATVVYGDDGARTVAPGYRLERRLWDAAR
ncbi:carboxylesterase family protein [Demequina sp. TTPB684]|uniref:carboxylesterase/lipase family protein n=1 Tax=unclassified Demequina TaxID=2620311 RepID=UPI001CF3ED2A|nr:MULTISPECIES: carboxylesterase family protein [unclassified Demequina]MCB2412610.1 carboxylesterase family protein [Demequina sp. TTPB684]UPU88218.1 carboxylesterase family protein [Demequina sp. TMPB413]